MRADLKVGEKVWVIDSEHFPAPEGLQRGQEMVIVAMQREDVSLYLVVRDGAGREWRALHLYFEPENRYLVDGHWYREGEPAALEALIDDLMTFSQEPWDSAIETVRLDRLAWERARLRRYGWELPPELEKWLTRG